MPINRNAPGSLFCKMRAREKIGYDPKVSLKEGIGRTIEWYRKNKDSLPKHYNVFKEKALIA